MKSAEQKLDAILAESEVTRDLLKDFIASSYNRYQSDSYAAGFLESMVVNLIMELPKAKRNEVRRIFKDTIAQYKGC
jgi:hypothetical protein